MDKLLSISRVADMLGLCQETLRVWDRQGKLLSVKTMGGHRRYRESDVNTYMGLQLEEKNININSNPCVVATYGRVSSHDQKQKGDLDRQCQRLCEYCAKKKYQVDFILRDVASGLSDSRSGLNRLLDLAIERKINRAVIENRDRLTRFQYRVLERFLGSYGVEIECVDSQECTDEQDLANDIVTLMAVFSGKLYGKRSAKRRREKRNEDNKIQQV